MGPRRPRVRALEAFPVRHDGRDGFALRDPEGLVEGALVVPEAVLLLLRFLDGTRTPGEVRQAWEAATGERLPEADLADVLEDLEAHLVTDGPRVEEARRAALRAWRARPARPAACAGSSYPADPRACERYLEERLEGAGDLDLPDRVTAVLAPHIDLRGGGPCHGAAAKALARSPAEVFVVLGTAHAPLARPFALTTHDFETPRGTVPTARDLVDRLAARGGGGLLDDELAHRAEHSVEFSALWLADLARRRGRPVALVPVLVGSFHAHVASGRSPREDPRVADFVGALRELRREWGERLALVASIDLAHVGPRYGGDRAVDDAAMAAVLKADRALLRHAVAGDPDGWMRYLHAESDRRNVCGAAPAWTLLAAIEGEAAKGRVLRHDAWEIDPETGSRVSFCAVAYGAARRGGGPVRG